MFDVNFEVLTFNCKFQEEKSDVRLSSLFYITTIVKIKFAIGVLQMQK